MKKPLIILLFISISVFAQENRFVKSAQTPNATILQTGNTQNWCSVCGMNLKMFYKTNHAIKLGDGTAKQYCSIRCLCVDKPNYKNHIEEVLVADAKSEKLINVEDAFYVIGSKARGTMTKTSKIAFSSKEDAEAFSEKFSGQKILNFKATEKLAKEQMQKDNAMLMKKKEMKIYPKGEKLYEKRCYKNIKFPKFNSISDLKSQLKNSIVCKPLNEKELQMVAIYLWDVKLKGNSLGSKNLNNITVSKDKKCPVCGMFVYKYPRWATVLEITNKTNTEKLYFDGVKDLMRFYFNPTEWGNYKDINIANILVTDYYKQISINGRDAIYVINSDIFGPMGNELIPFTSNGEAKSFVRDHGGSVVKSFDDVTPEMVKSLDE